MLLQTSRAGPSLAPLAAAAWRIRRHAASRHAAPASAAAASAAAAATAADAAPRGSVEPAAVGGSGGRQQLDYTALCACVQELQEQWVPSKVEEVVQPDAYTLSLRLRTPLRQGWLHLSWHPTAARACAGGPPARGAASEAFSFAEAASQQLRGLVLVSARVPQRWERVAALDFGVRPGDAPARRVYCEVMGKYSNVILTDIDRRQPGGGDLGSVVAAAYQVGGRMSSLRQVQQGRPYAYPPVTSGAPPAADEPPERWRESVARAAELAVAGAVAAAGPAGPASSGGGAGDGSGGGGEGSGSSRRARQQAGRARAPSVAGGLVRAYQGVSPALAAELCAAAGVDPSAPPAGLGEAKWAALHAQWRRWLERVESGSFAASLDEAAGRFSFLGACPRSFESAHEMLEAYYAPLQACELHASLHQRLTAAAKAALKKARGRVAAFKQQLAAAEGAGAVQRAADVIMANVYRIESGADRLEAEDWDTGEPLVIPLDPQKGAVEQAEALYRRARKLRRAVDAVAPLLEAAERDAEYLEQVESELAQLAAYREPDDLVALREVQDELVAAGALRAPPEAALASKAAAKGRRAAKKSAKGGAGGGGGGAGPGQGFRRYESPGGYVILVGRNNVQNDNLSLKVANPGDTWMHVRGLPGSHVLLRAEPGRGPPGEEDVAAAAALAAWFSKARASGRANVIVTRAEHVRKPKGAKPGQVMLTKEDRVVRVRPEDSIAAAEDRGQGGGGGGGGSR